MNFQSSGEFHMNGNSTEEERADKSGNARDNPEDLKSKTTDLVEEKSAGINKTDINDNVSVGETSETGDENFPKVTEEQLEEGCLNDGAVKFEKISSVDVSVSKITTTADAQDDKEVQAAENFEKSRL